jgi:hypothetical protein
MAYKHVKNVVRIHTDAIVLDTPIDFGDEFMLPEDKSTGYIHWNNCNCYKKIDAPDYNDWLVKNKLI